jgi:glutamyl-tRNA synthetase
VTFAELHGAGVDVFGLIAGSLGLTGSTPQDLLESFDPATLPTGPWVFEPPD